MMKGEFVHHNHGDRMHNLAIMIVKSICAERGYSFLDPRPFKDKAIYPGDPDVCVRIPGKQGNYENRIIEIETNPTTASSTTKRNQFSGDGITDLIIIDMRKLVKGRDWQAVKVGDLYAFLELWTP
jgi:hypothetical protein